MIDKSFRRVYSQKDGSIPACGGGENSGNFAFLLFSAGRSSPVYAFKFLVVAQIR
ncbi:MAG: hypothetical protein ACTFAK_07955 [Candidatus Electronema sp. VV]